MLSCTDLTGMGQLQVSQTVAGYAKDLPDLTHSVKYTAPPTASREQLIEVWKSWMQEACEYQLTD